MPTANDIEQALFAYAPREGAMDWDNVGLLVGDPTRRSPESWSHWISRKRWRMRPSPRAVR